ncbi:MAG: hypothetical protein E6K80_05280, partial [Candidatus Eisenbacteria bacterium]
MTEAVLTPTREHEDSAPAPGAAMTQKSLNQDLLKLIGKPGRLWWMIFLFDLTILAIGVIAERNQIITGIGAA